jgi:His/Glu/Gln/Arg/opine family amino acid ABC transporter permease subunit
MSSLTLLGFGSEGWGDELLLGALITLALAICSVVVGLTIGGLLAALKLQPWRVGRGIAHGITLAFRGTPEFLIILIVFFGLDHAVNSMLAALGSSQTISTPKFWAATLALGLIFGVYASEVFKGAFHAVSRGHLEAADALGMGWWLKLQLIHIPLMWRHALPGLMNLWLVLLKDTSLAAVIALDELLRTAKVAGESEREPFLFFLAAGVLYLAMTAVSERVRQLLSDRTALVTRTS